MPEQKHILFLTWKDLRHRHAGGAEAVMSEYAKGLVENGYRVTWFASSAAGAPSEEVIDGIRIVRKHSQHTVWMFAWLWYRGFIKREKVDLVIDEAGGWPLLSPLFMASVPVLFFVHHVGDREFDAFPGVVGHVAKWAYHRMFGLYRNVPTIAVSGSTKLELVERFGFPPENVTVLENATNLVPVEKIDWNAKANDVLFLGRLTAIKRTEDAIRAFASVLDQIPENSKLSVVGNRQDAEYVAKLSALVTELGISNRVTFFGRIDQSDFAKMVGSHRAVLVPSEKEGFGLVVLEANAYGLPAIAYDVAGLRDSVRPGINGVLVPGGDYLAMGREIVRMFEPEYSKSLSESSLRHVKSMGGWKNNVAKLQEIIAANTRVK